MSHCIEASPCNVKTSGIISYKKIPGRRCFESRCVCSSVKEEKLLSGMIASVLWTGLPIWRKNLRDASFRVSMVNVPGVDQSISAAGRGGDWQNKQISFRSFRSTLNLIG